MRTVRNAATLVLLLAAAACENTPTEPARKPEDGRMQKASPQTAVPRKGGNLIGSGY